MGPGHQLLVTTHGDLDCLGTVGEGQTYEDLVDRAPLMDVGDGMSVRVIDLPKLIELKEQAARPKDVAVLPVLRATLALVLKRS